MKHGFKSCIADGGKPVFTQLTLIDKMDPVECSETNP